MKILELRLKNLNSLYGEWLIDFTDPEYSHNGIFALTGPTGAGKTTILDAICLALYGATPRLGKITKSGNELMSRKTTECYSEVVFESKGNKYRSYWGQHRARKQIGGNLVDYTHEVSDVGTGKPIETKKSKVGTLIEELTGLDFDRFTRSMLLAQGSFDAFLKADVEQKSKILEQITGTAIYSEISQKVHERLRSEREKLNDLKKEIQVIEILDTATFTALSQKLQEEKKVDKELSKRGDVLDKEYHGVKTIIDLQKGLDELAEQKRLFLSEYEALIPERERLKKACNASELEADFLMLNSLRKAEIEDKKLLEELSRSLHKLLEQQTEKKQAVEIAKKKCDEVKLEYKNILPILKKVRLIDQKLLEEQRVLNETSKTVSQLTKRKEELDVELQAFSKRRDVCNEKLSRVLSYQAEHESDERLISSLTGIEEKVRNIEQERQSLLHIENELDSQLKKLQTQKQQIEGYNSQMQRSQTLLAESEKKLKDATNSLEALLGGRLQREINVERESLSKELRYLSRIESLEEHRQKLEAETPCPLCGSREHPFLIDANIPKISDVEKRYYELVSLLQRIDTQNENIKIKKEKVSERRAHYTECEKMHLSLATQISDIENRVTNITLQRDNAFKHLSDNQAALIAELSPYSLDEKTLLDSTSLIKELRKRKSLWEKSIEKRREYESEKHSSESEIKRIVAQLGDTNELISQSEVRLDERKKAVMNINEQRNFEFGSKNPDVVESTLMEKIEVSEHNLHRETRDLTLISEQVLSFQTRMSETSSRAEERVPTLNSLAAEFPTQLHRVGFTNESEFLEARMELDDRNTLQSKIQECEQRKVEIFSRETERRRALLEKKESHGEQRELLEIEKEITEHRERVEQVKNEIASINVKILKNEQAIETVKDKTNLVEVQRRECGRWEQLHVLIGSSDGKKFRNYAQGLTFGIMVSLANKQLQKMTDRYLLQRNASEPLELNVIDNYQAGEERSTKNLSGGESFIISLALALGLSKMASKKVRVDSLFLDEGFGTLDEHALEMALETLSGLHQEGKLIGIISHVKALKERITTQIAVSPINGGKSSIFGPGCAKL